MVKILFVCHGNICRSPMAEFVMKHKVAELTREKGGFSAADFEIASAATSTEEIGNPVYPPARRLLNSKGIDCSGHAARQMTQRDYDYYDYIILMDHNNLRNLRWNIDAESYAFETGAAQSRFGDEQSRNAQSRGNLGMRKKVSLMMDWTNRPGDVADPWYTGNFDATWRDVNEGCDGLLEHIVSTALKK